MTAALLTPLQPQRSTPTDEVVFINVWATSSGSRLQPNTMAVKLAAPAESPDDESTFSLPHGNKSSI